MDAVFRATTPDFDAFVESSGLRLDEWHVGLEIEGINGQDEATLSSKGFTSPLFDAQPCEGCTIPYPF
jgi:hypothetical protein